MDDDVDGLAHDSLIAEVKRLRAGIREHRDATGQDLCWHHPKLWALLPERTDPLPRVPPWPEFMRGCVRYRESLDELVTNEIPPDALVLWQRLDAPGHDACAFRNDSLEGTAVFLHESGEPACLHYEVDAQARVEGFIGARPVSLLLERSGRGWSLDGVTVDCLDLDLGFTPATNTLQLRRLALSVGAAADAPVAWVDVDARTIERLDQRYERNSATSFAYEAPTFGYAGVLDVDAHHIVLEYPRLWRAVRSTADVRDIRSAHDGL